MQTLEIITFILIAIIASGLFIAFTTGVDYGGIQEQFLSSVNNKDEFSQKTTLKELAFLADKCWSNCFFGDRNLQCGTFYVFDSDYPDANLTEVKSVIAKYNLCEDCNLIVSDANLPIVVKISCLDSNSDQIIISN